MARLHGHTTLLVWAVCAYAALRATGLSLEQHRSSNDVERVSANDCAKDIAWLRDQSLRIVVSLATTGTTERLQYVKRTLDNLVNQTLPPDRIVLTFPDVFKRYGTPVTIPQMVRDWEASMPILKVQQMTDYGPGSKLLGGLNLEKDPDTILIIVDDDVKYDSRSIETLVCQLAHEKRVHHRDVAPAFACEMSCSRVRGGRFAHTPGMCRGYGRGVAGIAYRVRYFDDNVWNITEPNVPEGCFINDDVWIGGSMFQATGVRPYLVKPEGWRSVLEHGSCEVVGTAGCGHTSDSSTVANNRVDRTEHKNSKHECERYFDEMCGDVEKRLAIRRRAKLERLAIRRHSKMTRLA